MEGEHTMSLVFKLMSPKEIIVVSATNYVTRNASLADQCLGNGNNLPSFQDYGSGEGQISRYHQAIISSYNFTCCGDITEWGVDVHKGGGKDDGEYTLDLQVWRPSPTSSQGYNLVGSNRFTSISLSGGVAEVTPSPQDRIQFRRGDVLGFYVEEARDDNDRGVVVITTESFTRDTVWLASTSPQNPESCPISIGSGGALSSSLRGAPVISIDTCE